MPFSKDTGVRENPRYCSLCFKDGKLCYEGNDLKEFQKRSYESMVSKGSTLYPTGTLAKEDWLTSPNGRYQLILQPDGNLVVYDLQCHLRR